MESIYDCFKLNNDMKIPCVGFGTYKAAEGNNVEILKTAIEAVYRYFDTASLYPRCGKMKWDISRQRMH